MLYNLGLMNRPKLNKVYHSFYNLFLGRIQGVKIGGVVGKSYQTAHACILVIDGKVQDCRWNEYRKYEIDGHYEKTLQRRFE